MCRGIGKALITLYVVGRKSGRHYTVPVAYVPHDGALLFGTPFGWGRNLYAVMVRAKLNFAKSTRSVSIRPATRTPKTSARPGPRARAFLLTPH